MKALTEFANELRTHVSDVEAECFDGRDAARLTRVAAEIERLGGALRLLFGRRAVETNGWVHGSQATRAEQWYAQLAGINEHRAAKDLQIADRLADCPATEERLRDGTLSRDQAEQVTSAAASDPGAEARLLDVIDRGAGMRELRDEHDRAVAAATDMRRARDKAHRERHLRTWVDGAATRGSFSGPTDAVFVDSGHRVLGDLGATPSLRASNKTPSAQLARSEGVAPGQRPRSRQPTFATDTVDGAKGCRVLDPRELRPQAVLSEARSEDPAPHTPASPATPCPMASSSSSSPTASTSRPSCPAPVMCPRR